MDNWTPFAKATFQLEKRYTPKFYQLSKQFRSSFTDYLQANGAEHTQAYYAAAHLDLGVADVIQDVYKTAGVLGAQMQYQHIKKIVGRKSGLMLTKGFGLNAVWIQLVLAYLKIHLLNLAQAITETMRSDALNILSKGVQEGWGIEQMVQELQKEGFIRTRAQTIARTEVSRAANVGHSIGAQSLPFDVNKKWISAHDHRTRHSHKLVDKHLADEHGTFSVPIYKGDKFTGAYDAMQFPGDPSASAGNTVNCRCRVIYEPKLDENKTPLSRPGSSGAVIIPISTVQTVDPSQIAAQLRKAITFSVSE